MIQDAVNLESTISAITVFDNIISRSIKNKDVFASDGYGAKLVELFEYLLDPNPQKEKFKLNQYITFMTRSNALWMLKLNLLSIYII